MTRFRKTFAFLVFSGVLAVLSLSQDPNRPVEEKLEQTLAALRSLAPRSEDPGRLWTILIYMAGDNNLEGFALDDMNEIEAGLPDSGVEVIVLIDRCRGFNTSDGDWSEARVYRLRPNSDRGKIDSTVLARLGEIDTGRPEILAAFAEGALKSFPSRRTMMILWDHGGGWAAMAMDQDNGRGGESSLSLPGLGQGLRKGLAGAGLGKFDLVGFDMCHMGQLETAVEIAGLADAMIASENLEPGKGWPYDLVLPLFGRAETGTLDVGSRIVKAFDQFYDSESDASATLSVVNMKELDPLVEKLEQLLAALTPLLDRSWPAFVRALFFSESYAGREDYRYGPDGLNSLDLLDMMKRIRNILQPFPAETAYGEFKAAFDRYIVLALNNEDRRLSNGVAVYAPVLTKSVSPRYVETHWARISRWPAFLAAVHARQDADRSEVKLSDLRIVDPKGSTVTKVAPISGHTFKARIEGRNILWTWVYDGFVEEQSRNFFLISKTILTDPNWFLKHEKAVAEAAHTADLDMIEYKDGATDISSEFEGIGAYLYNGKELTQGTIDLTSIGKDDDFSCPAELTHSTMGAEPVDAVLYFDRIWTRVTAIKTIQRTESGSVIYRNITLEDLPADLKVTPLFEVIKPDNKLALARSKPINWEEGIELSFGLQPPGSYQARLLVEKMNGRQSSLQLSYEVIRNEEMEALFAGWSGYKPDYLIGTWDLFVADAAGAEKPAGQRAQVSATTTPGLFETKITSLKEPITVEEQFWRIDLVGLPNIRFIARQNGRSSGAMICPAVISEENGQLRLQTKMMNLGGMVWIWLKTGGPVVHLDSGGAPKEDPARFVPVQTPDPKPLRIR